MRCLRCSQENPPEAKFCNGCGQPLSARCGACAHANPLGSRFCNACGHPLSPGGAAPVPSRRGAPEVAVPSYLAEKILTSRAALEGERKQVTVLFADLSGSMALLADRDPEEARALLDPLLERMMEAVHRYEGTVNQVMGDGIMALFGAPVAHEDHAVRACYAALRMQDTAGTYGDEVQRRQGVALQIRVGLNSGQVVVRSIGSDLRMDYSAVGQTTHLAARMEQMAKPGSILLAADTLSLAEGYVDVKPLGPVPVRGLPDPVEVFELVGASATRTRLQARAVRGLTRFVGRDRELAELHRAQEQAGAGRGQVVAFVGEAGIGKSRLVWEFVRSHRVHGWLVLESSAVSFGKATSFQPLVDLLRTYFAIDDRDDARRMREKITGRVLTLDEGLKPVLPTLIELLGASPEADPGSEPDRETRQTLVLEAVRRLFLRESQGQPVLLVFEDLHWIDADTQAVLDGLVDSLPAARVLLLVNYRPEYRHGWGSRSCYRQLRLDPLTPEGAETFLGQLLAAAPDLAPLRAALMERTQGNPFFLEECVRALVETGDLVGERGAYRLARPLPSVQLPRTVQALLAARIDRLAADDKHVLQCAAVIGNDVSLALLQLIVERSEDALRGCLARLQAAEFLYETRLLPDPEYTFKHALTLEVVYGSLLTERRRVLHGRIVEVLEALYRDRASEHARQLAHHAFRGEVWPKAVAYLHQTGAQTSTASLDAAVLGGPESPGYFWWTGEHERAVKAAQRDLAAAASFGAFHHRVVASFRLAQACHALGDYQQALDILRGMREALGGDLARELFGMAALPAVLARAWLGWCLAEQGEPDEAVREAEEGLRLAEQADHAYSLVVATAGLGMVRLVNGQPGAAVAPLERGLALSALASLPLLYPLVAAPLGAAYAKTGRTEQGTALLEQAVARASAAGWLAHHGLRLAWLAESHLQAGQPSQAALVARHARELARAHGERSNEAYAGTVLGESLRAESEAGSFRASAESESSGDALQGALGLAEALGLRPLVARCRAALDLG